MLQLFEMCQNVSQKKFEEGVQTRGKEMQGGRKDTSQRVGEEDIKISMA